MEVVRPQVRVPLPCYRAGNCVATCDVVAPRDGSWDGGGEGSCCRVGSWLGACHAEDVAETGKLEEKVDRRESASISSDVVGVVLKAPRIHCAAECQIECQISYGAGQPRGGGRSMLHRGGRGGGQAGRGGGPSEA